MSESGASPAPAALQRWRAGALEPIDTCETGDTRVLAADSWLVLDGRTLGIGLHRERFVNAVPTDLRRDAEQFWDAAVDALPRQGEWFPRVDLRQYGERRELQLRLRPSPERTRSVRVATHPGRDPRKRPTIKGPDLESMLRIRTEAQSRGADEAVIVSPEGYLVEGAYSGLAWWRGDVLSFPAADLERVDSVTARSLETLATALGVEVIHEHSTAAELADHEVWTLSALHGIRIVTEWVDGPALAERPGRLELWRRRLETLRRPLS